MAVGVADRKELPPFPSSRTIQSLSPPNQNATLRKISDALKYTSSLPDIQLKRDALSTQLFVSSYVRDGALVVLQNLVFSSDGQGPRLSAVEKEIRNHCFSLVERLAGCGEVGALNVQDLLDIAVVYGVRNASRVLRLFTNLTKANPSLLDDIKHIMLPSLASILIVPSSALHAIRKGLFCILTFLQCAPPEILQCFYQSNDFVLALARCYDERLAAIASSYGGIHIDAVDETDTTRLWVECKVACIDSFHIILQQILHDVKENLRASGERAIELVFSLLGHTQNVSSTSGTTPFLNRPFLADYQQSYSLSLTLTSVLHGAEVDDPRLDVLDATLKSFDADISHSAGALKILLHSNGLPYRRQPPSDRLSRNAPAPSIAKGKGKEEPPQGLSAEDQLKLDLGVSKVMEILPDYPVDYIRDLLNIPGYDYEDGAERIVADLLEGTAPSPKSVAMMLDDLDKVPVTKVRVKADIGRKILRSNEWSEGTWNAADLTQGKREQKQSSVDESFIREQLKADILRRAAELSDEEDEDEAVGPKPLGTDDVDSEDDLDAIGVVTSPGKVVAGDEDSSSGDESDEDAREPDHQDPETILELAYIRSPKVFDRDVDTRRSKARADLKAQTGWADEQIEGWRVMLERNPKKDKILQKHEFSGNRPLEQEASGSGSAQEGSSSASRGRSRGRGGFRGRGRGNRGGGGGNQGGGGGNNSEARERAWKDKNKSRQANHNRKRGHDKKMARGGATFQPT